MSRGPDWRTNEDRVITRWYPYGGVEACAPHLPHKPLAWILNRAQKMRVRKISARRGVGSPPWGVNEDRVIVDHYSAGGVDACKRLLPDRTCIAIQQRAAKLRREGLVK